MVTTIYHLQLKFQLVNNREGRVPCMYGESLMVHEERLAEGSKIHTPYMLLVTPY